MTPVADLLFRPYTGKLEQVNADMLALAYHVREHGYALPLAAYCAILDDLSALALHET